MGGLGPGIGGGEWLVIGVVALLVVGPERLPGLLRELGKWVAKARGMANEFRQSFDDMARQSELDDLRKEVEALRSGTPVRLGADADKTFADIKSEFDRPLFDPAPQTASTAEALDEPVMVAAPSEWPVDTGAVADTTEPVEPLKVRPSKAKSNTSHNGKTEKAPAKSKTALARKTKTDSAKTVATGSRGPAKASVAKARAPRAKAIDL